MNNKKYESPKLVPMQDVDLMGVNGGGVPVAVFIIAAGVTYYAGAFVVVAVVALQYVVGHTKVKSVEG